MRGKTICARCGQEIDSSSQPFYFLENKPVHENTKNCIDSLLTKNKRLQRRISDLDTRRNAITDTKIVAEANRWYRIVDAFSTDELSKKVDALMLQGWHLCGGVSVATLISNQATLHFYQAMRRDE